MNVAPFNFFYLVCAPKTPEVTSEVVPAKSMVINTRSVNAGDIVIDIKSHDDNETVWGKTISVFGIPLNFKAAATLRMHFISI